VPSIFSLPSGAEEQGEFTFVDLGLFVHFQCSIYSQTEVIENSVCTSVSCSSIFLLSWFSCHDLI